jgi:hypothetical protein
MNKYLDFLEQYRKHLGDPQGISEQEIDAIEQQFNIQLPLAYKEYIKIFGKKKGRILKNNYTEVSYLARNRAEAIDTLKNTPNQLFVIKDNHFFFGQWQGYSSYFFECASNEEDPAVYILDSGKAEVFKSSFSLLIKDELTKILKFDGVIKK